MSYISIKEIEQGLAPIEINSYTLETVVDEIVARYSGSLDKYVAFIADCLKDGENPPTDAELDDFVLNLAVYIYNVGSKGELLGIRDDISRAVYREAYNTSRSNQTSGTIADKDSAAEMASQKEAMISLCYSRAYKIIKSKIENAQELLSSVKKVLTRRIQEYQVTNAVN